MPQRPNRGTDEADAPIPSPRPGRPVAPTPVRNEDGIDRPVPPSRDGDGDGDDGGGSTNREFPLRPQSPLPQPPLPPSPPSQRNHGSKSSSNTSSTTKTSKTEAWMQHGTSPRTDSSTRATSTYTASTPADTVFVAPEFTRTVSGLSMATNEFAGKASAAQIWRKGKSKVIRYSATNDSLVVMKTERQTGSTEARRAGPTSTTPQKSPRNERASSPNRSTRLRLMAAVAIPFIIMAGVIIGLVINVMANRVSNGNNSNGSSNSSINDGNTTQLRGAGVPGGLRRVPLDFLKCFQNAFGAVARNELEDHFQEIEVGHLSLMDNYWQEIENTGEYYFDQPDVFDCDAHTLAWWWLAVDQFSTTTTTATAAAADNESMNAVSVGSLLNRYHLACLYISLHGRQRNWDWLTGGDECDWENIRCNAQYQISSIELDGNKDNFIGDGRIPSGTFEMLTSLEYFTVQNAGVVDPVTVNSLSALKKLDLSGNLLRNIPDKLDGNWELTDIDLSHNHLEGTVPSTLFSLPFLQSIDLRYNPNLEGPLPDSACAPNVTVQVFADCRICGQDNECCTACYDEDEDGASRL